MHLHQDALTIFRAALEAAEPSTAVMRHLRLARGALVLNNRRYRLDSFQSIYVVGAGKAGAAMARPIEKMLGARISGGLINVKYGHTSPKLRRIRTEPTRPLDPEQPIPTVSFF